MSPTIITFSDTNRLNSVFSLDGTTTPPKQVQATMFGGIYLNTNTSLSGSVSPEDHFSQAYDHMGLNFIRFPDGEMPDGFAVQVDDGSWKFRHNKLNGGDEEIKDPSSTANSTGNAPTLTQAQVDAMVANGTLDDFLDDLVPAVSLGYPDFIHPELLAEDSDRVGLTEALDLAVERGAAFSIVLPEFQYLRPPVTRTAGSEFDADDHVKVDQLQSELTDFLTRLSQRAELPEPLIIELGNEDFFGWNKHYFSMDDAGGANQNDNDSYSAYVYASLDAIKDFRAANPDFDFKVSMQAQGVKWTAAMEANFVDMEAETLFAEIDIIDTSHVALDATTAVKGMEHDSWLPGAVNKVLELIDDAGGDRTAVELYNSAWSANAEDVDGYKEENFSLPAAASALSALSGLLEMGFDYTANWGIDAWGGFYTLATKEQDDAVAYSPYAEVYRQMAESLVGTYQLDTGKQDVGREGTAIYAFMDDAKGVVFLAANDFAGDTLEEEVDLQGLGDFEHYWVERISQDGEGNTVVTREAPLARNGSKITVQFKKEYEVLRLVVNREEAAGDGSMYWNGDGGGLLEGTEWADSLFGGTGVDVLNGLGGNDILHGEAGNDTLNGNHGDDTLFGGDGDDKIYGGFDDDRLEGGDGADFLRGYDGADLLIGGAGDDNIDGQDGDDRVNGGAGDDTLNGGAGIDTLDYSTAAAAVGVNLATNTVWGDADGDTIQNFENLIGSDHDDTLHGDAGDNQIEGGTGNDTIYGEGGDDSLYGNAGDDTFFGGAGNDLINGGAGSDTAVYAYETSGVTVNLATGATSGAAAGDILLSVENLEGTEFADELHGDASDNRLEGRGGDDLLFSGSGVHVFDGGAGEDTVDYSAEIDKMGVNLAAQSYWWGAEFDQISNVENLIGSDFNDNFQGTNGNNILRGGLGNDTLRGRHGFDTLYGDEGNDVLEGGTGNFNDVLYGGTGDDTLSVAGGRNWLYGQQGNDTVTGHDGDDVIHGGGHNDTLTGGGGEDTFYFTHHEDVITDFTVDEDKILLRRGIWGGGDKTDAEILAYATVDGGNLVFDFGGGHELTLIGITDETTLEGHFGLFG